MVHVYLIISLKDPKQPFRKSQNQPDGTFPNNPVASEQIG